MPKNSTVIVERDSVVTPVVPGVELFLQRVPLGGEVVYLVLQA